MAGWCALWLAGFQESIEIHQVRRPVWNHVETLWNRCGIVVESVELYSLLYIVHHRIGMVNCKTMMVAMTTASLAPVRGTESPKRQRAKTPKRLSFSCSSLRHREPSHSSPLFEAPTTLVGMLLLTPSLLRLVQEQEVLQHFSTLVLWCIATLVLWCLGALVPQTGAREVVVVGSIMVLLVNLVAVFLTIVLRVGLCLPKEGTVRKVVQIIVIPQQCHNDATAMPQRFHSDPPK
jgi:hypothetical protein